MEAIMIRREDKLINRIARKPPTRSCRDFRSSFIYILWVLSQVNAPAKSVEVLAEARKPRLEVAR